jgi:hypothetical protein
MDALWNELNEKQNDSTAPCFPPSFPHGIKKVFSPFLPAHCRTCGNRENTWIHKSSAPPGGEAVCNHIIA